MSNTPTTGTIAIQRNGLDRKQIRAATSDSPNGVPPTKQKLVHHGRDCPKIVHLGAGYLHGPNDDEPYNVDGVTYCGRCHGWLEQERQAAR